MTELKRVSNEKLKENIKFMDLVLNIMIFGITFVTLLSIYSMNTLGWISFFILYIAFLMFSISKYLTIVRLENREGIQDIKDMIKIQEEGNNYDK